MIITDKAEPAGTPAAELDVRSQIVDLDAEQATSLAAEDTEKAVPEDTEAKADEPVISAESADGSDEDKIDRESESKRRRAREKTRIAALVAEIEALKRIVPKQDDALALDRLVESRIGLPPKEADFSDFLEFDRKRTVYEIRKETVADELKQRAAQAEEFQRAAHEEIVETFMERAEIARKSIKDFDEVTTAATMSPAHPEVKLLILSSEKGPELAYHLSKNPKVVQRLNEMSPFMAAREIGKLEASVSSATPRTVTKAPAPVEPLKGGTAPSKKPWDMSMAEYEVFRKGQRG